MGVTSRQGHVPVVTPQGSSSLLERLIASPRGQHRVISCYIPLPADAPARRQSVRSFRSRLRAAVRTVDQTLPAAVRDAVGHDLARVERHLAATTRLPDAGGLAAFACGALDLFEVVPLPRVHRPRLIVDRSACVRELVEIDAEFGLVHAVAFDQKGARFFAVSAFEAVELPGLPLNEAGGRFHSDRQDSPGWGERQYHNRITEERHRHFEEISRRLRHLDQQRPARGVVLIAPGPETVALERFLDPHFARRVLGAGRLSPRTVSPAMVFALVARLRRAHLRFETRHQVDRMQDLLGEGWAVNGVQPSLDALFRGQVQALLVAGQLELPGYRTGTGRLVASASDVREEGPMIDVPDLLDDAIEEALRQRVSVVMVEESDARNLDGLAGILRFR